MWWYLQGSVWWPPGWVRVGELSTGCGLRAQLVIALGVLSRFAAEMVPASEEPDHSRPRLAASIQRVELNAGPSPRRRRRSDWICC